MRRVLGNCIIGIDGRSARQKHHGEEKPAHPQAKPRKGLYVRRKGHPKCQDARAVITSFMMEEKYCNTDTSLEKHMAKAKATTSSLQSGFRMEPVLVTGFSTYKY